MEDWQQWQIQADQIASGLGTEVDALEAEFFPPEGVPVADRSFRSFWPRFRDLKERVRTAPAIRLEDKLALERRLRGLGSRAYKAQEETYGRSGERKAELLAEIDRVRQAAETAPEPRALRDLRKELDGIRTQFDAGALLVPADRQALWDAWRAANDFVWQKLNALWAENEEYLRGLLAQAAEQIEQGHAQAAKQTVGKFFESLRTHEAKQATVNGMKQEAEGLRRSADEAAIRRPAERRASTAARSMPATETWRAEVQRNRDNARRLEADIAALEADYDQADSILQQAMIRGNLVEKKRRLSELERSTRALEQRIEQAEESPVLTMGG